MNKKTDLMAEALKRFKLLNEYDFYIGEDEEEFTPEGDLITEEPPQDEEAPEDTPNDAPEGDLEAPEPTDVSGDEDLAPDDLDMPDEAPEAPEDDMGAPEDDMGAPEGGEALPEPLPEPEPMEDEVDVDVTDLVQGTEAAKESADKASAQIADLLGRFEELTASLDRMDAINAKIDELEHEIETRNPTPKEKLEMRSLDSYPYSLKLSDYWNEKEGNYDAMGNGQKKDEKKEYVLTQDEVNRDYNSSNIKDSFQSIDDEENFNDDIVY